MKNDVRNFSAWCVGDMDSPFPVMHEYQYESYDQFSDCWLPSTGYIMAMCPMDAISKAIDRLNNKDEQLTDARAMFYKEHPNDRFFIDNEEVHVDKLNAYFDAHDTGWETVENDGGGVDTIIFRE